MPEFGATDSALQHEGQAASPPRAMDAALPLLPFAAVVVAAGQGLRAGQPVPKQFACWRGKPLLRHSVEALLALGAERVVVAIPQGADQLAAEILDGLDGVRLVPGGGTRQLSVAFALEALAHDPPARVLIHDAARPDIPPEVAVRLLAALERHPGAIPVLPVVDSLIRVSSDEMVERVDREALRRVQTPQAFRFPEILAAHRAWAGEPTAGDDAQVLHSAGGAVALVEGHPKLAKLTFAQDFVPPPTPLSPPPPCPIRVGMGYDVHRLAPGEQLWLGGVPIPHDRGLSGHSDADVGLHALVDALLGAIGDGDIGAHFPPSDPRWKGTDSARFVQHAASRVASAGYRVGNVDITLVCEAPRIGPYRAAMRARIAGLLGVDIAAVSVKATTTEKLGFTGRGEGIAAQAVATLVRV